MDTKTPQKIERSELGGTSVVGTRWFTSGNFFPGVFEDAKMKICLKIWGWCEDLMSRNEQQLMTIFPILNGPSKGLQQGEGGSHQPESPFFFLFFFGVAILKSQLLKSTFLEKAGRLKREVETS